MKQRICESSFLATRSCVLGSCLKESRSTHPVWHVRDCEVLIHADGAGGCDCCTPAVDRGSYSGHMCPHPTAGRLERPRRRGRGAGTASKGRGASSSCTLLCSPCCLHKLFNQHFCSWHVSLSFRKRHLGDQKEASLNSGSLEIVRVSRFSASLAFPFFAYLGTG